MQAVETTPKVETDYNAKMSFESFSEPSERIRQIKADLFASPYSICLERPTLWEEFECSTEGRCAQSEHPLVRRAMALAYVLSHRKPRIYDGELIIGNMTSKRIAANYYQEGGSVVILEDIFRLGSRNRVPLEVTLGEKLKLTSLAIRHTFKNIGGRALLRPGRIRHFLNFFRAKRYFITEEAGISHQVGNYRDVVHNGLRRTDEIAAKCLECRSLPNGSPLNLDQEAFYRSVRITIAGIRRMAANLAEEAERLASDPACSRDRRAELLESAQACRHVPYEPARTFLEGLQACWLVHMAMNQEDFEQGLSFGRLDQILFNLYQQDLENGRLNRAQAADMLASFELKTCETIPLYSERIDQYFSGNGVAQGITVGGTDSDGNDVTNELSGLILDAYAQIRTREPALHVRVHKDSPKWFLDKAVEVVQLGCGKPSFFGDEQVVRALKQAGMSTPHARDYAVIGCVEMASQGRTYNSSDAALFNVPICLELTLNRGRRFMGWNPIGRRFGAATKPVIQMRSFDDVVDAFRLQVRDSINEMAKVIDWLEETYKIWRPTPINSILTEGCLDRGYDVTWGGAFYDFTSIQAVGLADAGDSLYAIKRLVFDEARLSLPKFVEILKNDYQGHEAFQLEITRHLPRYGNGDPEADRMTQLAADIYSDEIRSHKNSRGGSWIPGIYSMTCYIGFGRHTGALPNGRKAGRRLSNGLSPGEGAERSGPTALLNSVASLDSSKWANCCALNIKFDKSVMDGEIGRNALASLFRTYFNEGGMQVQANVVDADMLREARKNPSAYPHLVVRVAGYCAYFTDLQPAVQDEIIERATHGLA